MPDSLLYPLPKQAKYIPLRTSCGQSFGLELWPRPGACPVLFYPGTMTSPAQYQVLLAALWQAGFAPAALHLSGHGLSQHQKKFSFATFVENGLCAEEWLLKNEADALVVCGHSQGAIITLAHIASPHSQAKAAFALAGTLPQLPNLLDLTLFHAFTANRKAFSKFIQLVARLIPCLPVPLVGYLWLPKILAHAQKVFVPRQGIRFSYPISYLSSLLQASIPLQTCCPLELIYAKDDALFTPQLAQQTYAAYQEQGIRNVSLRFFPEGGHLFVFNPRLARRLACCMAVKALSLGLPLSTKKPLHAPFGLVDSALFPML